MVVHKNEPLCLYGDDMRLRQILLNLLGNAIKFTDKGNIRLTINLTDTSMHISVSDTGIGIPAESLPTLFDAFEQVDLLKNRCKKGTGLGLTITKAIVEMMGGHITVESEYGKGTSFNVELPKVLGDATLVEHIDGKETALYAPDAQILVVDDNETNLNVACGLLRIFHITADAATSGRRAIDMIKQKHYDIVFMDHRMPEMSGVETTKLIRGLGIDVPIIALTASAVIGAKDMMLEAGMNDYLWKPIEKAELVHMLQKWIPAQKLLDLPPQAPVTDNEASSSKEDLSSNEDLEFWQKIEQIEEIELSTGLNRAEGQKDVYKKSLELMMGEIEKSNKSLIVFLMMRDMEQFCIAIHGIKGSLASIGVMGLSSKALALENASKTMDIGFCLENLPSFLDELSALHGKLKETFSILYQSTNPVEVPPELSGIFTRLIDAIGEFDLPSIEKEITALDTLHLSGPLKEKVEKIKDYVMIMDYDSATELIRKAA
jgi:CheY-like chemotaxis protein/HPt (histidine-containing phosphotransfer) domain-containing protein